MLALARQYDVTLITHPYFEAHIEPELSRLAGVRPRVIYFNAPGLGLRPERLLNSRTYYLWWQWRLGRWARRHLDSNRFDLIHHLTWGSARLPSFLGGLGAPFVMGPLGGGDPTPLVLMQGLPWSARLFETVRLVGIKTAASDPLVRRALSRASLIMCKTDATVAMLPRAARERAVVAAEIGAPSGWSRARDPTTRSPSSLRLLFAGRLIGLKGVHLAIGAVRVLRDRDIAATLQIAGAGPLRSYLEAEVARYDLASRVVFLGEIARERLLDLYGSSDVFVFPSLRDSSGNVVLEALSRGLPVVCLDLGGPPRYITPDCGVAVGVKGLSRSATERALANELEVLSRDPERLERMSAQALAHARTQTWESRVDEAYAAIASRLNWPPLDRVNGTE
jgi:glycosyltransferase involved in cell wall biosynthesis